MPVKPGVFCLEGPWENRLTSTPDSIRQVLEFFSSTAASAYPLVYRRVFGRIDFAAYVEQWKRSRYRHFESIYFASHGRPGRLTLGKESIKLLDIAQLLKGACHRKTLMFGGCCTLDVPKGDISRLLSVTGARAVVGYVKSPDWVESTVMDLLFLENLRHSGSPEKASAWLKKNCSGMLRRYGFRVHLGG